MKFTKDEARILAEALEIAKYEWHNLPEGGFKKLEELEESLNTFGDDKRRKGRTSQNDWSDLLKRYTNQTKQP
jgi:hypothetical protein